MKSGTFLVAVGVAVIAAAAGFSGGWFWGQTDAPHGSTIEYEPPPVAAGPEQTRLGSDSVFPSLFT